MKLVFNSNGNEKQKEVYKYWADDVTEDTLYGGSKGCFVGNTLVRTIDGYSEIKNIKKNEQVLTIKEGTDFQEWKKVIKVKKYGNGYNHHYHKMIIFTTRDNQKITLTTNHEIYINGNWITAGELAGRILEIHTRNKQSLRHFQQREGNIPTEIWTEKSHYFKTYEDKEGLFKSRYTKQPEADTQISLYSFQPQPSEQTYSKSFGLRQDEQRSFKFRMGNGQRECELFKGKMSSTILNEGRGYMDEQAYGAGCEGNKEKVCSEKIHKENVSGGVRSKPCNYKRCGSAKELDLYSIKEITFSLMQGYVYDLQVEDNHNYCVSESNFVVHNSGKSYLGCNLIFGDALMYPETNYFIARKKLNDLRRYTIPSINEVFDHWGLSRDYFKYNGQDNYFELYNGSRVQLIQAKYEPSDPDYARFGSMQMTRGWIEEAGEFEFDAMSNLKASIGRWKNKEYGLQGKLLQTCNPAKNYLYKDFYLKHKKGTLENYKKFIQALPEDNKMLPDGYLQMLDRTLSKSAKKRLLKGLWEYDDDPSALVNYDAILSIYKNDHIQGNEKYITADIARLGSDKAVILVWDGLKVIEYFKIAKSKTTEIQSIINSLRNKYQIPKIRCIADEDGVGGGVVDNCDILGFINGSRALNDENYQNLKTQCYYKLAEYINKFLIFVECEMEEKDKEEMTEELEQIKSYEEDKEGKLRILPKEKIKDLIGRSPDWSDSLMMRMYFVINPPTVSRVTFAQPRSRRRR